MAASGAVTPLPPAEAPERATYSKCRVLLAEDIDISREIVMALLEDTLLHIDCATDGREAVERFTAEGGGYDLIFMDIQRPVMDGLEATRRLRATEVPGTATVPIDAKVLLKTIARCLKGKAD